MRVDSTSWQSRDCNNESMEVWDTCVQVSSYKWLMKGSYHDTCMGIVVDAVTTRSCSAVTGVIAYVRAVESNKKGNKSNLVHALKVR